MHRKNIQLPRLTEFSAGVDESSAADTERFLREIPTRPIVLSVVSNEF